MLRKRNTSICCFILALLAVSLMICKRHICVLSEAVAHPKELEAQAVLQIEI